MQNRQNPWYMAIFMGDSMILSLNVPSSARVQGLCHIVYKIAIVYSPKIRKISKSAGKTELNQL